MPSPTCKRKIHNPIGRQLGILLIMLKISLMETAYNITRHLVVKTLRTNVGTEAKTKTSVACAIKVENMKTKLHIFFQNLSYLFLFQRENMIIQTFQLHNLV